MKEKKREKIDYLENKINLHAPNRINAVTIKSNAKRKEINGP